MLASDRPKGLTRSPSAVWLASAPAGPRWRRRPLARQRLVLVVLLWMRRRLLALAWVVFGWWRQKCMGLCEAPHKATPRLVRLPAVAVALVLALVAAFLAVARLAVTSTREAEAAEG